jgi:HTH-type transcriptional regulator / antitoxin HigA
MFDLKPTKYLPEISIPPGETIKEMLTDLGMTQANFAERMGRPANKINELLQGKQSITADTALALELVLGIPAYFWLNRENDYQLVQKRIAAKEIFKKRQKG